MDLQNKDNFSIRRKFFTSVTLEVSTTVRNLFYTNKMNPLEFRVPYLSKDNLGMNFDSDLGPQIWCIGSGQLIFDWRK